MIYSIPVGAAVLGPASFWDHGCIEKEATVFIRQYTADRPLLQKVFDPHANDVGTYQARELSYLIDFADARAYPYIGVHPDPRLEPEYRTFFDYHATLKPLHKPETSGAR